ncbi:MAG: cbb3-type cytochrome c oxidase subunit I [Chloroflexi bacterium]|nr:cbb3-type cytochrome c oxidase subunit I [Chloroflexota bacterium]
MNRVAIVFLQTALVFFVAGMVVGAVGLGAPAWMTHERSVAHAHLLLVGWLMNTVIGVAWWMFPRIPGTVAGPAWVLTGWGMLNGGLLLRVGLDLFGGDGGMAAAPPALRWSSALLQLGGALLLAAAIARRVRPPSQRPRTPGTP